MPTQTPQLIYESGGWEIDLTRRELRVGGKPVAIGGRAFEIVETLVRSAGQLVTKDELMDRVWHGAIVEENTLQVHIWALRKALGRDRGLLKTASGRGYRLLGSWIAREAGASATWVEARAEPTTALPAKGNVPTIAAELVGRSDAVKRVRDLLSAYRAVTLTGPGGIGKTALALEVARAPSSFDGERWLIELASLSDPGLVPSAVASVLGLRMVGSEISAEPVARAIGDRKLLLLLDNCEHVVEMVAEVAETVLRLCPNATVMATSRELLRIAGEHVYRVLPLEVPPPDQDAPSDLLGHSAVQLFLARTAALATDPAADAASLSTIAAICRRLDGIPLAIEFAAARAATLGLSQVAKLLDDRFRLLTGGRRTALPRHQTLRAALDWSYDLLSFGEAALLRRLAVFAGDFSFDAAIAVAGDALAPSVVDDIASLVAKSLIVAELRAGVAQYRLLETIRLYALVKARDADELKKVARRHAQYYRDLILSAEADSETQSQADWMAVFAPHLDNVRSALDWAFSPDGDPQIGIVLTAVYAPGWMPLLAAECRERTERALDSFDADLGTPLLLRLHIALGVALWLTMGLIDRTKAVLARAQQLAGSLDDADALLRILWARWNVVITAGECRAAQSIAEQFARVAARIGDRAFALVGDRIIGATLQLSGAQNEARRRFERVLQLYVMPTEKRHMTLFPLDQRSMARGMLTRVLWLQGYAEQAMHQARVCLAAAEATDPGFTLSWLLHYVMCPLALMSGDLAEAERTIVMLKDRAPSLNAALWTINRRCLEAKLLVMRGEFAAGAALLQTELERSLSTGWAMGYPEYMGTRSEGLAGLGRFAEAIAAVDDALARAEAGGELYCLPELLRIKGEVLLCGDEATSAVEACFNEARAVAREQGALFWELRASLSLARLRVKQGRADEARYLLAPVYDRFTEGFETPDMRAARSMLRTLPN